MAIVARRLQSEKCADTLQNLQSSRNRLKARLRYNHVDAHMDRILLWHQLSMEQKLNCICDALAKSAIALSMRQSIESTDTQLLPREDAAAFIAARSKHAPVN